MDCNEDKECNGSKECFGEVVTVWKDTVDELHGNKVNLIDFQKALMVNLLDVGECDALRALILLKEADNVFKIEKAKAAKDMVPKMFG